MVLLQALYVLHQFGIAAVQQAREDEAFLGGVVRAGRAVEEAASIYGISSTSIRKQIKLSEDIDANIGKLCLTK